MRIENRKSYRIRQGVCAIIGICASMMLTSALMDRQELVATKQVANAQERLADEVFRFHVLANSDKEVDQELKLKVRDRVLSYMEEAMELDKVLCGSTTTHVNCRDVKTWAAGHLDEIEQVASNVIFTEGFDYPITARVTECYFPDRRYGDVLFPKGYYEALRVEIGEAKGHNWWCVLYPSLCFTDATCAVVTEDGEEELQKVLDAETYKTVTATSTKFRIKSFFYELFKEKLNELEERK